MLFYGEKSKIEAFETLKRLGLFIPFKNLELYHGRAAKIGEQEWKVNPSFNNAGNKTGNRNINKIMALSTANKEVASNFAKERSSYQRNTYPEVIKIGCCDPDAVILNASMSLKNLSQADKELYFKALTTLSFASISEGAPIPFEKKHLPKTIFEKIKASLSQDNYISLESVKNLCYTQNLDSDLAIHIAGAMNANMLLQSDPKHAVSKFWSTEPFLNSENIECPLNHMSIANWLSNNHIVGAKFPVWSATLDENIENFSLFDLNKINSQKEIDQQRARIAQKYNGLDRLFSGLTNNKTLTQRLLASPKDIVNTAKDVKDFQHTFDADAGNWERFTLGEHTETVLRVFNDTYAHTFPERLLPFMNLCLLVHDIGKAEAIKHNEKPRQKEYTHHYANIFLENFGVDNNVKDVILGVIGTGQTYTTDYYVNKNTTAKTQLQQYCKDLLVQNYGNQVTNDDVSALDDICSILQTCDSAAYTDYAVTRSTSHGTHHYNYPSFNSTFEKNSGLNGRIVEFGQ